MRLFRNKPCIQSWKKLIISGRRIKETNKCLQCLQVKHQQPKPQYNLRIKKCRLLAVEDSMDVETEEIVEELEVEETTEADNKTKEEIVKISLTPEGRDIHLIHRGTRAKPIGFLLRKPGNANHQ